MIRIESEKQYKAAMVELIGISASRLNEILT